MSTTEQLERITQNRVVNLFQTQLGYTYLGNWEATSTTAMLKLACLASG